MRSAKTCSTRACPRWVRSAAMVDSVVSVKKVWWRNTASSPLARVGVAADPAHPAHH